MPPNGNVRGSCGSPFHSITGPVVPASVKGGRSAGQVLTSGTGSDPVSILWPMCANLGLRNDRGMTDVFAMSVLATGISDFTAQWLPEDWTAGGAQTSVALLGILAVLALIDSTSFGTLLIPVWLLMAPGRLRAGRLLVYLGVVAGAYAVIGLVLLVALTVFGDSLLNWLAGTSDSRPFLIAQAAVGAGLILYSLRLDPITEAGKARKREREASRSTGDRLSRFRSRAVGESPEHENTQGGHTERVHTRGGTLPLLALALTAVGLEIATLLPYLAGIGLVAASGPQLPGSALMILFYCAVMILPALVLLTARIVARRVVEGPLARLEAFLSRHANGTVALILFLLGLFLGLNALGDLGVL